LEDKIAGKWACRLSCVFRERICRRDSGPIRAGDVRCFVSDEPTDGNAPEVSCPARSCWIQEHWNPNDWRS